MKMKGNSEMKRLKREFHNLRMEMQSKEKKLVNANQLEYLIKKEQKGKQLLIHNNI